MGAVIRTVLATVLTVVLLVALPAATPASADASARSAAVRRALTVNVADMQFQPRSVAIGLGSSVIWRFRDGVPHTTTSNQGFWNSGNKSAGQTYVRAFTSAGRFAYFCKLHPHMTGSVAVPMRRSGAATAGWTLRWSTKAAGAGRNFDVQVRRPGSSTWVTFRTNTTKATAFFNPPRSGLYRFRARTGNTNNGGHSGWSAVLGATIS